MQYFKFKFIINIVRCTTTYPYISIYTQYMYNISINILTVRRFNTVVFLPMEGNSSLKNNLGTQGDGEITRLKFFL